MPSTPCIRRDVSARCHIACKTLLLLFVVFAALPARADGINVKNILLVVPRTMQRTALNMVTFRNRELAIQQWVDIAATFADAETTRRSINRGSAEYNPFLGTRPSAARTYVTLLTVGFTYANLTQVVQERVQRPRPFTFAITGMAAFSHSYVAYHNTTVCPGNLTCNPQP